MLARRALRTWSLCGAAALALLFSAVAWAGEHPEHPGGKPAPANAISKEGLGRAIRAWVAQDTKLKGGYFLLWDAKAEKPLALTLTKVHDDKLAEVAKGTYFACADFKNNDEASTMYDIDIFMKGSSEENLQVTEVTIHKENGQERYSWKEENGIWKRVEK